MKLYYWTDKNGKVLNETCSVSGGENEYNSRLRCNRNLVKFYLADWIFDKVGESFVDSFCRMAKEHGFERKEIIIKSEEENDQ